MSGSIKGSLENVVKGKLVLKGNKGVGGGVSTSSSRLQPAGISKETHDSPKMDSSAPKLFDTRTPYEKVRALMPPLHKHSQLSHIFFFQKVADARNKRELEQLRSVSVKSHKQRLEVVCELLEFTSNFRFTHSQLQEFNAKLSSLPEINEIPNVAGGG